MCGIAGFWASEPGLGGAAAENTLRAMATALVHRGPDAEGIWRDDEAGVGLAHRRLSILDLSPAGAQPMRSASGRYVLIYNGEIYNHLELRKNLELQGNAPGWRGHSDTETLAAAIEAWGVEKALHKLVGMFAFAVWDRQKRSLLLARDRLGEKPLYYGRMGSTVLFGSELKALRAHPGFRASVNRGSVALLLKHNYVPAPYTIYSQVKKLQPGCFIEISSASQDLPEPQSYWSATAVYERCRDASFTGTEAEAANELERLLLDATKSQMLSDVPLGAFLSGGIDSSAITALMQAQSGRKVRTFSIGFHDSQFNEADHAKAVAAHLGTDHTEYYVTEKDALDVVPELPRIFDEPFADSSQIPTLLLSRLTRQQVTVAMSGDGGDELFGGYNRYLLGPRLWAKISWLPGPLRRLIGTSLEHCPQSLYGTVQQLVGRVVPRLGASANLSDKALKVAAKLRSANDIDDLFVLLLNEWPQADRIVLGAQSLPTHVSQRDDWARLSTPEERMMAVDAMSYLPDDILVKVDRSSMAASLETRAPFLDHRVFEFAAGLPLEMKISGGIGKRVLRQVLYRHVPKDLVERPKQGFGIPLDDWLRTTLRDWAEDLLAADRLDREGYFETSAIREVWDAHRRGDRNHGYKLWSVLMFQSWLESEANS